MILIHFLYYLSNYLRPESRVHSENKKEDLRGGEGRRGGNPVTGYSVDEP